VASGFPLPLRNALAELAIAALRDDEARAALAWLADAPTSPPPAAVGARLAEAHLTDATGELLPVHAPWADAARAHAARAVAAADRRVDAEGGTPVSEAVRDAVALWNARLFFEVHEVLEAVWKTAAGPLRQGLQGVIQVAVAYHHLAHDNPRGARTLMRDGRARLADVDGELLAPLDAGALLADTVAWETSLLHGRPMPPAVPSLRLRAAG
jgi:hypothetical protein